MRLYWRPLEHPGESSVISGKDGKRRAIIRLRKDLETLLAVEVLIHEWAHLLAWDYHGTNENGAWALAYCEVYELVYGDH